MKTFKQFFSELYNVPVVSAEKVHNDLNSEEGLNDLNKNLAIAMAVDFSNVGEALHKAKKILSMYGVELGKFEVPSKNKGSIEIPVTKFNSFDEFDGKTGEELNTHKFKFNFEHKDGKYNTSAEVSQK